MRSQTKEEIETQTIQPVHGRSFQCDVPHEKPRDHATDLDEEDRDGQIVIEKVQNVIQKMSVCFGFSHWRFGQWCLFF